MATWWGSDPTYEQRSAAAWSFLNDGNFYTPIGGTSCNDSFKCATGFSCIDGKCVSNQQLNENGSPCDGDNPYGDGRQTCYRELPSSGCVTGTCGSTYEADCCGERCCRFDAYGSIRCYCGPCPKWEGARCGEEYAIVGGEEQVVRDYGDCDYGLSCVYDNPDEEGAAKGVGTCQKVKVCIDYCDEYYKTNGQIAGGCSYPFICDECQECTGQGENTGGSFNFCQDFPSGEAPPCWCDSQQRDNCTPYCKADGTYSEFYPPDCKFCCKYEDYCGDTGRIISKEYCTYGYDGGQEATIDRCAVAREYFARACKDLEEYLEEEEQDREPNKNDCFESCYDVTTPDPGPCNFVGPAADPGVKRTVTGCLQGPGAGVTFFMRDCRLVGDGCYKVDPGNPTNNIITPECDCDADCGDPSFYCNGGVCQGS